MEELPGIFYGDAPQFIILSIVGAFLIGYFNFAFRLMYNVNPHDRGFFEKQTKKIRFNNVLLLISFSFVAFRILYCNFVRKEIFPEFVLFFIDLVVLLLIVIAVISARNFFRDGLDYIKLYSPEENPKNK